jgi:hypothetical protein
MTFLIGSTYATMHAAEVETLMHELGFEPVRAYTKPIHRGLFGWGGNKYVYRKRSRK